MLVIPDKLKNFIRQVQDQNIEDIVISCEREMKNVRQGMYGDLAETDQDLYMNALENFQGFLLNGNSRGINEDPYLSLYRPILKKLVSKGQLRKDLV